MLNPLLDLIVIMTQISLSPVTAPSTHSPCRISPYAMELEMIVQSHVLPAVRMIKCYSANEVNAHCSSLEYDAIELSRLVYDITLLVYDEFNSPRLVYVMSLLKFDVSLLPSAFHQLSPLDLHCDVDLKHLSILSMFDFSHHQSLLVNCFKPIKL